MLLLAIVTLQKINPHEKQKDQTGKCQKAVPQRLYLCIDTDDEKSVRHILGILKVRIIPRISCLVSPHPITP